MEDANNIVIKPTLLELFQRGLEQYRVILFSAPCGFGKTATASALLAQRQVCVYHAAEKDSLASEPPADCDTVLINDFQMVTDAEDQQKICDWIRANYDKRFVFLSRGVLPGWLVPFQFTGALLVIDAPMLLFDRATTGRYLEKCGITVAPAELTAIQNATTGYPMAVSLLCRHLERGEAFCDAVADKVWREMFLHYETSVYHQFEPPVRQLLISLAPFAQFNLELAQMVSGDSCVGELLGLLQRDTTMMIPDGQDTYHFWPAFQKFLLWELSQEYSTVEQNAVYSRAGLYYELHQEYARALDCYSRCGDNRKVSALLMKNVERHPGIGHYYDMENYYYAIPEKDVLRSIPLMCAMSMLTALNLDYEASEHWYAQLQSYTARLSKGDAEYKDAQGKLAYLNIALPQRGSKGLLEIISSVFRVLTNQKLSIPAFSVTSTLPSVMNGGKNFCEWSTRDDILYETMRKPVELVLGKGGVGLADCAICESKFEKGEDISGRLLTLISRLGEIQRKGTQDMEFAVLGLLVRLQTSQGQADTALSTLNELRDSFVGHRTGQIPAKYRCDALPSLAAAGDDGRGGAVASGTCACQRPPPADDVAVSVYDPSHGADFQGEL